MSKKKATKKNNDKKESKERSVYSNVTSKMRDMDDTKKG